MRTPLPLDERGDARTGLGAGAQRRAVRFGLAAFETGANVGDDRLRGREAGARRFGDLLRPRDGAGLDGRWRDHAVHHAEAERVVGRDRASRQHEVARHRPAEHVERARDPVAGIEAEVNLGQRKPRAMRGDPQILRDRQHEAAAERVAVDHRDCDLGQAGEAIYDLRLAEREGFRLVARDRLHLCDVVAGTESSPLAAQEHHAQVVTRREPLLRVLQRSREAAVERVQRLRASEREARHTVGDVGEIHEGRVHGLA